MSHFLKVHIECWLFSDCCPQVGYTQMIILNIKIIVNTMKKFKKMKSKSLSLKIINQKIKDLCKAIKLNFISIPNGIDTFSQLLIEKKK